MDYDQVLDHVGQFGLWQIAVFILASLAAMTSAFMTMQFSFIGYSDFEYFRCAVNICEDIKNASFVADFTAFAIPQNESEENSACQMYQPINQEDGCIAENFGNTTVSCSSHVFSEDIPYEYTLTQQLDMPSCSNDPTWALNAVFARMTFINSGYMVGLLIGSMAFGVISDKFGRRKALILGAVMSGCISVAQSFVKNYWLYFVLRLLLGISAKGLFMIAFMICVEISGVDYKTTLGILIQVPFAIGEMLVSLIAYYVQNWPTLQQVTGGIVLGLILLLYLMPESPRWLLSKNKYQEARKVLTNGSKLNRRPLPEGFLRYNDEGTFPEELGEVKSEQIGVLSLFKNFVMAKITIAMFLNWITANMVYYGLQLSSVNLSDDIYVNFMLLALIEIPSYIFCVLIMDRMGRKPILIFCQILAGSTCIIAGFVTDKAATIALTLAGKFGASASFAIVYLYTAELYPTVIRNSALGANSMVARLGGIAAPILAAMDKKMALIIMGVCSLVAGIVAIILPETLGSKLPETISEVNDLYDNAKPLLKWVSKSSKNNQENQSDSKPNLAKKNVPTATVAPSRRQVPSIIIIPGTPKLSPFFKPKISVEINDGTPEIAVEDTSKEAISEEIVINIKPSLPEIILSDEVTYETKIVEPVVVPAIILEDNTNSEMESNLSLDALQSEEKSRRFSQLPPASNDDPNAVKVGNFAIIPTIDKSDYKSVYESETSTPPSINLNESNNLQLSQTEEKSRRFSKLPPVAKNNPNASKIGHFAITKTPEMSAESEPIHGSLGVIGDSSETKADHDKNDQSQEASKENVTKEEDELVLSPGSLGVINDNSETKSDHDKDDQDCQSQEASEEEDMKEKDELVLSPGSLGVSYGSEKSRRFSQLPPADTDSPNAVKLGSKFTMIPMISREVSREDEKNNGELQK